MQEKREWYHVYEEIKKSVVVIQVKRTFYGPNKKGELVPHPYIAQQGSGFLYERKDKKIGLITAYHVLRHEARDKVVVHALTRQNKWVTAEISDKMPFFDEKEDIAAIEFNPEGKSLEDFETVGFPAYALKGEILQTGVDIVWCGYPATIGPFVPVFQKGMIAGYAYSRYIVDGMLNPGMSGGPVFYNFSKDIVGMITARAPEPSLYTLAIMSRGKIVQEVKTPSGLGIAIPAANILSLFKTKS